VVGRERVEGKDLLLGLLEHRRDLAHPSLELGDGGRESIARFLAGSGVEDGADERGQNTVLVFAGVAQAVTEEVHRAALPRRPEHLRQRRLQARVGIRDRQLDANQPTGHQAAQELAPERLGLGLAHVQPEDLPPPGLVHTMGDHHAPVHHPPAVPDLLHLGIDEQIRIAALQRPLSKRLHLLIE